MKPRILFAIIAMLLFSCSSALRKGESYTPASNQSWSEELARKFVALSIMCTQRDAPHEFQDRNYSVKARDAHPAFFGCYDWHSGVHGHWAMVRVLKSFPKIPERAQIEGVLDAHLRPELMLKELEYFKQKPRYELPYGQGWFLRLSAELRTWKGPDAPAHLQNWIDSLAPLEKLFEERLISYLEKLSRPIRHGDHYNTAFSLVHVLDYAVIARRAELKRAVSAKAREFFGQDKTCPTAYEPSAYDFVSPCLAEADLMRRVLTGDEWLQWNSGFFPQWDVRFLSQPVFPKDKKDPYLGHLIGLMFHKAGVFHALGQVEAARTHEKAGLDTMFDSGYGGEHWLATFAIYDFAH